MLAQVKRINGITTVQVKAPGAKGKARTAAQFGNSHPSPRQTAFAYAETKGYQIVSRWS